MYFDFALILTVLTLLSGAIWLLDRLFFAGRRRARHAAGDEKAGREPAVVEYARSFFPVLLLVLVFRSFLFEPFKIPSGSMLPTLLVGDFILVNKYVYGLRLPVLNSKIIEIGEPERGDVMVFRYPLDERQNYIKRVIGLPGDRITYRNKQLFINGEAMAQVPDGPYEGRGRNAVGSRIPAQKRTENLAGRRHEILIETTQPQPGEQSWVVPEGHYFMMGDNRDHSSDSRVWGLVPEGNIVGRALAIWWHWDCSRDCVDFSRLGNRIE